MNDMRAWAAAVVVVVGAAVLAGSLGAFGEQPRAGDGLSIAGKPVPRAVADPAAGEPAYLGWVDGWVVLLDQLRELRTVEHFRARSTPLTSGRIVATAGKSLIAVPPGGTVPEKVGTVSRRTYLLGVPER